DPKQALIYQFGSNFFGYVVRGVPDFDLKQINFDGDITAADTKFSPVFGSHDPDLSAFRNHGGKLIQYHGWADPAIPALDSVDYYRLVQKKMGPTGNFYRLFMAPDLLVATKFQGDDPSKPMLRQRPLCSFPARAQWDGQGDRNRLESYRCVAPKA